MYILGRTDQVFLMMVPVESKMFSMQLIVYLDGK